MDAGLGAKFWLRLAGVMLAGAAILFVILMLISHALYAWGFVGGLVVVGLICVGFAWFFDRRNKQRLDRDEEHPEPRSESAESDHLERF